MVMDMLRAKKAPVKRNNFFSATSSFKKLSPEEVREKIEKKAYELYEQRGCTPGNELGDWFEAERIVLAELNQASR